MFSYRLRTSLQSGVKSALFNQKPVHSAAPQSASISQGTQFFKTRYDVDTRSEEEFATPFQYKSTIASISPKHYANEHATGKKLFGPATVTGSALRTIVPLQKRSYSTALPQDVQRMVDNAPKTGYLDQAHFDGYYRALGKEEQWKQRNFIYFMLASSRFIYAAGIRLFVLKLLLSWSPSASLLAVARIEVDISSIPVGKTVTITWRGKPIFVRHRTEEEIAEAQNTPMSDLKDPQADSVRVKDPNWLVLLAICTHLGCVPVADAGSFNAFFCPCHGSHYDISGRIRKGPAPLNLEVPPHSFLPDGKTLVLG